MNKLLIKGRNEDGYPVQWIIPVKQKQVLGEAVFEYLLKDNIKYCNEMTKMSALIGKHLKDMPWAALSQNEKYQQRCKGVWGKAVNIKQLKQAFIEQPIVLGWRNDFRCSKISFLKG